MSRFNLKFKIFDKHAPFRLERDKPKPVLSAIVGAIKNAFGHVQDNINDTWAARWLDSATGDELDMWGIPLNLPRDGGESDEDYLVRLKAGYAVLNEALTLDAIENAVNAKGATFLPPLSVSEMQERYDDIWYWSRGEELATPAVNGVLPWSEYGRSAPAPLPGVFGRFTVVVVLSRAPTSDEAIELGQEVWTVKWAAARVLLVTEELDETYTLHREVFVKP